jgi:hypothetical protein
MHWLSRSIGYGQHQDAADALQYATRVFIRTTPHAEVPHFAGIATIKPLQEVGKASGRNRLAHAGKRKSSAAGLAFQPES